MKRKHNNNTNRQASRWSEGDRQAFADRNILRAQTVQMRRATGPQADEWFWEDEEAEETFPCMCWDTCTCKVGSQG